MLLAIDIGNTNIVCGVFDGDSIIANARISTYRRKTADEYGSLLSTILSLQTHTDRSAALSKITDTAMSSVVPPLTSTFKRVSENLFGLDPLVVGPGIRTELPIKYDDPRKVGADRIVNAVAGCNLYPAPQIILDFGTALTFCAINSEKEYVGGAICPGIRTSYQSLSENAALLSMIEFRKPLTYIGKSTEESLMSGAINGYASLVEGMVARFKTELGDDATVIGTGGMVDLIADATDIIQYIDPNLTLKGLKILHNLNRTN